MKKALCIFTTLVMLVSCMFIPNMTVEAASISLGVSASSVKIGDSVSVTVSVPENVTGPVFVTFSNDILEFTKASVNDVPVNGGNINISIGKYGLAGTNKVTLTFKAKTSGSAKISATHGDLYDDNTFEEVKLGSASTTITVANKTTESEDGGQEAQKSADNSLSSLKLSNGTLSPSFKRNVTKYTATVGYDVTKVIVSAKVSNEKATIESVTGDGTVKLKVGENTIKVVVRAENGVKATYTIVVTRKAQETTNPEPSESESTSESESESETTAPEVNEVLQWNGEQLQAPENIPSEKIPTGFESTLLVVNGQQIPGLSFVKGELKVLYLNNTNGAGSLYVYDEAQQTIYPFIKLTSEKHYVMVLLPDEQNAPAPAGFESCTLSIEGKGLVSAYQLKEEAPAGSEEVEDSTSAWNFFGAETFYAAEPKVSDFYLIYCMNDEGEKSWYMYDSVEGTYQRYLAMVPSVQVGGDVAGSDIDDGYAALEKELNNAKMTQYIIIAIAAAVVLILAIIIVVLVLRNRNKDEDFFDGYEDEDDEEYYEDDDEEDEYAEDEYTVDDYVADDEIEIEFYEMEPEVTSQTEERANVVEDADDIEDEEIEIEFFNMEDLIVSETETTEEKLAETPVAKVEPVVAEEEEPEIKIVRRPRVSDPTSKLSSKKEDDDDLEFIDFE